MQPTILVCLLAAFALTGCAGASSPSATLYDSTHLRADLALARLGYSHANIQIVQSDSLAAYSYSTGSILLTRALIDRTSENQLAAVIAHELGHLTRASSPERFTLTGSTDQEQQADDFACRLLRDRNIPASSLGQALTLVRDDPHTSENLKPFLTRRIARLP